MQSIKSEKYYAIMFLIMGVLVFSPMSSIISINILHLPLALPEVLLVPFIFLLKDKFKSLRIKQRALLNACLAWLFLLIFALLASKFSLFAILSNARAWLYLFLFFGIFINYNEITNDDMLNLAFGSIIGWAIACYFNINRFMARGDYHIFITYGLMLSLPLFYSIAILKSRKMLFLIGIVLNIVIIMLCGTRRVILVTALSIISAILIQGIHKKKNLFLYIVFSVTLFVGITAMLPTIEEGIKELSPHLHYRLFTRSEALAEGGTVDEGDVGRLRFIASTYDEMDESCFPHGFISMQTSTDDVGRYNDYPIIMLFWIFSWPLTFIILFYFVVIFFKNFSVYVKTKKSAPFISVICLLVMFALIFFDGSFFTYAYATPITGALLGMAKKNS